MGDWIEFGYKKVWHIKEPMNISSTKNIVIIIDGCCLDSNNKKIKGICVVHSRSSTYGQYLDNVIENYGDKSKSMSFQRGGGVWQYRGPYLRKIPLSELALIK